MPNETEGRIPLADLLVFHQLARSLTSSFDLDKILRTILEQMERMVEAEFWALLMLDESTHDLYYAIAAAFISPSPVSQADNTISFVFGKYISATSEANKIPSSIVAGKA